MFKRGFKAVEEEKKRQEEAEKLRGQYLFDFFLKDDGDEADVHFLMEEPTNFFEHNIQKIVNGKKIFTSVICSEDENCPYCAKGESRSFKGAFLVIDKRPYTYKDKNGKEITRDAQIKIYKQGAKVLSQLDRISQRYGLSNRDVTIVRLGTGTSTSYTVERGDKVTVTPKEIEELLPEKLREQYDGSEESLISILENQLMLKFGTKEMNDNNYDDDEEEEDVDDTLVSVDDEEEKRPIKKSIKKPSKLKFGRETSTKKNKPSLKSLLKR